MRKATTLILTLALTMGLSLPAHAYSNSAHHSACTSSPHSLQYYGNVGGVFWYHNTTVESSIWEYLGAERDYLYNHYRRVGPPSNPQYIFDHYHRTTCW